MTDIKKMDIKEFQEKGFLQEVNRLFFHPLGLALEVIIDDDESYRLGGIWDYREDPEGIFYAEMPEEMKQERIRKRDLVEEFALQKSIQRKRKLGYIVQPLD